jgi:site-specific recombinase XerD
MLHYYYKTLENQQWMQEGPLGPYINDYAVFLHQQLYSWQSIRNRIRTIADWSRWLLKHGLAVRHLNPILVRKYLQDRYKKYRPANLDGPALNRFLARLYELGIVQQPVVPKKHLSGRERELAAFGDYILHERGLSASSAKNHRHHIRRFLKDHFCDGPIRYSRLRAKDITSHVQRQATQLCPSMKTAFLSAMRSFLRYLRHQDRIKMDLAACVPAMANWKLSTLPKYIEASQVQKFLDSCDRSTSKGRRSYAILLLLARLGLRAGEVVRLQLEDIDWDAGGITIHGKGQHIERLPLPHDVGQAIAVYLKKDRPACQSRSVFVRRIPPYKGFHGSNVISILVHRELKRAGIQAPRMGAHLLRHSLATTMLRRGASLPEIGRILRHHRIDATAAYAKVDLVALRRLARPWPGGVQ